MGILADDATEAKIISALQFVKVSVGDKRDTKMVMSGFLTDVSVAMLMVEMKRQGLVVTNGER